jgi:uncharacterized protein involved in exopolysaccharide biosynthesis
MENNIVHVRTLRPGTKRIQALAEVLFRHSRLAIGTFIAMLVGVVIAAAWLPQTYESDMKFLVTNERVDPVVSPEENAGTTPAREVISEETLNSEVELLKSGDVLQKVLLSLGEPQPGTLSEWLHRKDATSPWQVQNFRSHLQIEVIKKSNIIEVRYACADAQFAAKALRKLTTFYLDKHLQVHRPAGEYNFFAQQVDQYQKTLSDAEAKLAGANTVAPQMTRDIELQKVNEFRTTLEQSRATIRETQLRILNLEQQGVTTPARLTTQLRTSDNPQLLEQLKSTLLNLQLKRDELLTKYQPTYRPVQDLTQQIDDTRAAIDREESHPIKEETTDQNPTAGWISSELAKSKTDLEGLKARAAVLEKVVATYEIEVKKLDRSSLERSDIERAAKIAEDNYILYSRKREQARISEALDRGRFLNVAVVQAAEPSMYPQHSRLQYGILGLFLALCLTGVVIRIVDRFDPSFHTPDDVSDALGVRVLAYLPKNTTESLPGEWSNGSLSSDHA